MDTRAAAPVGDGAEATMGDPHEPWQDYGQQTNGNHARPRHLTSSRSIVRPYVFGPGIDLHDDADPEGSGQDAWTENDWNPSDPGRETWHQSGPGQDAWTADARGQGAGGPLYGPAFGPSHGPTPGDWTQNTWGPDDGGYDPDDNGYDPDAGGYDADNGRGWSLRSLIAAAAWRYRSAPLWARLAAIGAVASLVLALIVGVSLLVRSDDRPRLAATNRPPTTTLTTSTSVATTTTVPPTTTTAPTTSTTVATTTSTVRPAVPAPTQPPPPPTAPTTTTTRVVRYRDCTEAALAGALPLFKGEPGYAPYLDRDGDGEACEADEPPRPRA